jgi:FkbM family methyltransferase
MTARIEVRLARDLRMVVDTSDVLGRTLAASGVWEPKPTAAFESLLSPGDVCVDVGANVGYFTLLASRLVGPEGHVYALEPEPQAYEALCSNLELNAVSNVTALALAAGAEARLAPLFVPPAGNLGRVSLRRQPDLPASREELVSVRTVSSLVSGAELERLRLVKIDVEGYEVEVLRGLEELLEAGVRPAVLVEVHAYADPDAPAYVVELCSRFALTAYTLDDRYELDAPRFSPRVRRHSPRRLTPARDLPSIPIARYDLLLTG